MSAQEAELKAHAEACKLALGKKANIYMDSRYAFGIVHDYGPIWRARDFLTSAGQPIKNKDSVFELMNSLLLPEEVAIIKVKAHTKHLTTEARGNDWADKAAKQAALQPLNAKATPVRALKPMKVSRETLIKFFEQASPEEKDLWTKQGDSPDGEGLWRNKGRVCLPCPTYPAMAQEAHGPTHLSKSAMILTQ
ncbi:uncharacterized protein LOC120979527 isoform X2 [Bufo bufo]|uniref:uncharacterized protein LOC120979527 isoform X2 n=1 Tax=Bufo bufo TaxID=8384 RepID=UPI001ABE97B4|nr:uncharacterized protein LOC120979527 isoform X2 [Bufo bufo]